MSKRIVALIRHGAYHQQADAPSALQPHPLSEEGEQQARACGAEIAQLLRDSDCQLDPTVHSSRQLRAWQTARIACDVLAEQGVGALRIVESEGLSERSVGSAANLTVEQIEAVLESDPRFVRPPPGWKSDSDYCLPLQGAESLTAAGQRVAAYLRSLAASDVGDGTGPVLTLVFGHGASFRHAAHELGIFKQSEIAAFSMYHARPLRLCYSQGGRWLHVGGQWKRRPSDHTAMD